MLYVQGVLGGKSVNLVKLEKKGEEGGWATVSVCKFWCSFTVVKREDFTINQPVVLFWYQLGNVFVQHANYVAF